MTDVVIIDGFRTPYAKAGTVFKDIPVDELGAFIMRELIARTGIERESIDEVIVGNAGMPAEAANIGRVIALRAGVPQRIPAYSVQRNCASGMQAVASAYTQILANMTDISVVAGVESMSNFGFYTTKKLKEAFTAIGKSRDIRSRISAVLSLRPGDFVPVIGLNLGLTDPISGLNMGQTAEVLVRDFSISRREQDEFSLQSHLRWAAANDSGKFRNEVIPVYPPPKFDAVEEDIGPRRNQTLDALQKLKPFFDRKSGTVTPGNSSPITDGAAAALVMNAQKARELGYRPLGRIRSVAFAGCDPSRMGLGPVFAMHKALRIAGMTLKDIDLIELNEAFAAQVLACIRAASSKEFFRKHLGNDEPLGEIRNEILNVNGGAIAVGHPVGSSGLRVIITLLKEMERRDLATGLATLCIGGGQGGAMIVERI